jgi:hypothetical protein
VAKLPLPALPTKRDLAIVKAKFDAWWLGEEFDATKIPERPSDGPPAGADDMLFDREDPARHNPRFLALQRFWGEGRVTPGDSAAEALLPVRLAVQASGALGLIGPGLIAPVSAMAVAHPGELRLYEWRDLAAQALNVGVQRSGLKSRAQAHLFDLETGQLEAESLDGVVCFDAFTFCAHPSRLAVQIAKALKPNCGVVIETYVGASGPQNAAAFASSFLEPQIQAVETLTALLFEAGLRIESEADLTDQHLEQARAGLRRLAEGLGGPPQLTAAALREVAWEAEAWRARKALLSQGALRRRMIHAIRR